MTQSHRVIGKERAVPVSSDEVNQELTIDIRAIPVMQIFPKFAVLPDIGLIIAWPFMPAEQAVLEAKNKLERVKVEAQQREAEAKGEADARIAKAIGEAEYIRVVTEAQVAANKDIAESLTPEVLQYILLDRLGEDIKVMVIPSGQGLDLVLPELQP